MLSKIGFQLNSPSIHTTSFKGFLGVVDGDLQEISRVRYNACALQGNTYQKLNLLSEVTDDRAYVRMHLTKTLGHLSDPANIQNAMHEAAMCSCSFTYYRSAACEIYISGDLCN